MWPDHDNTAALSMLDWRAMQPISGDESDATIVRGKHTAAGFFWGWLIVATAMSVTGNVAHAVLQAPANTAPLAAGAALVPPVVLLAATHSIALLVRTRAGGFTYWSALLMTLALAACAFVLSFEALRSLAVSLGLPRSIAWLWPCAIDVAIAQATLCLLSLSRRQHSGSTADVSVVETISARAMEGDDARGPVSASSINPRLIGSGITRTKRPTRDNASAGRAAAAAAVVPRSPGCEDTAAIRRWQPIAESLVRDGVTSKHPDLVATILAQRDAGVPPSTIGRTHKVHHTTVGRILSAAEALTA
jgi:Protein of unknown function (DUF2637)